MTRSMILFAVLVCVACSNPSTVSTQNPTCADRAAGLEQKLKTATPDVRHATLKSFVDACGDTYPDLRTLFTKTTPITITRPETDEPNLPTISPHTIIITQQSIILDNVKTIATGDLKTNPEALQKALQALSKEENVSLSIAAEKEIKFSVIVATMDLAKASGIENIVLSALAEP